MSPKSIVRVVRRALTAARAPRADETDFLGIAIPSTERVRDHQHSTVRCSTQPQTAGFERGVCEVRAIQRDGIQKTVMAASNVTPCLAALASGFRGSQSNTHSVYTELGRRTVAGGRGDGRYFKRRSQVFVASDRHTTRRSPNDGPPGATCGWSNLACTRAWASGVVNHTLSALRDVPQHAAWIDHVRDAKALTGWQERASKFGASGHPVAAAGPVVRLHWWTRTVS